MQRSYLTIEQRKLKQFHNFINQATQKELKELIPSEYKIYKRGKRDLLLQFFRIKGVKASSDFLACAESLFKAVPLTDEDYTKVWDREAGPYDTSRTLGLLQGIDAFEKEIEKASCAFRISLLLLSHHVEHTEATMQIGKLAHGHTKRSHVLRQLAEQGGKTVAQLKSSLRKSQRHVVISKKAGLGILLVMGSQVAW